MPLDLPAFCWRSAQFTALRPGGRLVVVEHLRNPANFLAFGPQFTHFYSAGIWLALGEAARFDLVRESRITPFVGLFVFEKPG